MIISTTDHIDGKSVTQYLGIVSGCGFAPFGGPGKGDTRGWVNGLETAQNNMTAQATALDADAVIGVSIGLDSSSGSVSRVYISGTAVKLD